MVPSSSSAVHTPGTTVRTVCSLGTSRSRALRSVSGEPVLSMVHTHVLMKDRAAEYELASAQMAAGR